MSLASIIGSKRTEPTQCIVSSFQIDSSSKKQKTDTNSQPSLTSSTCVQINETIKKQFKSKGDALINELITFFNIPKDQITLINLKVNKINIESMNQLYQVIENNSLVSEIVSNNYSLVIGLAEKFIKEKELDALVVLVVISRMISSNNVPTLVSQMIKYSSPLISILTKYMIDISSEDIVNLIKYSINSKEVKDIIGNTNADANNTILDYILSVEINQNSITSSIRELPIDQVVILIKYLFSRINLYTLPNLTTLPTIDKKEKKAKESTTTTTTNNINNILTIQQIVQWISILIDANFQQILQNIPDFYKTYVSTIKSMLASTKSCFFTKSFIEYLEKMNSSSSSSNDKNTYSIYLYKF
ncbi:hypothetical protein CYY_003517 [Polysphondylium violaceum]|uniref:Uncharacterized protein n=1 Tax=Polysphondylium violaceum TaxID=133409 RepID=A0A8J4PYA7_9MYCE|nr:hypothetical protein CYY_003517 [Polysphondylium violaceum]